MKGNELIMEEINELLNSVVNYAEEKEAPFKFDNTPVETASYNAEKIYKQLIELLESTLDKNTFNKTLKLFKDFRIKELEYCRQEHVLYYKEGFADGIKLIVTSMT